MILHLNVANVMDTTLRHAVASVGDRKEPSFCGFATAGAEIGRPAYIVASRRPRR